MEKCKKLFFFEQGIGLLEILVSLALSLPLSLLVLKLFSVSVKNLKTLENSYEQGYKQLRIEALFNKIIQDTDRHNFNILPLVHKIKESEYDAISNLVPDIIRVQRLKEYNEKQKYFIFCPINEIAFKPYQHKSYLGIHLHGFLHLTASSEEILGSPCRKFFLQMPDSIFVENKAEYLSEIKLLMPVTSEYTLYVDVHNDLRLKGYAGGEAIEKQPLLTDILPLKITDKLLPEYYLLKLKVLYGKKQMSFVGSITRKSHLNFLSAFYEE